MGLDIEIKAALEKAFAANTLEVINESHKHSGHSGDDGSGESHWRIAPSPSNTGMRSCIGSITGLGRVVSTQTCPAPAESAVGSALPNASLDRALSASVDPLVSGA